MQVLWPIPIECGTGNVLSNIWDLMILLALSMLKFRFTIMSHCLMQIKRIRSNKSSHTLKPVSSFLGFRAANLHS